MIRYIAQEVLRKGDDKEWWRGRILDRVARPYFERVHKSPDPIIPNADWDHLLLLDACRYDLFAETASDLPGTLSIRTAHESATPGYLAENFENNEFHDIVYVTSNPYVNTELSGSTFHDIVPVWKDGWDNDLQVVPPEAMLKATRDAINNYNEKRIIAHFTQPHVPFIGDVRLGERKISSIREQALGSERPDPSDREPTPFELLARGEVTREEVWKAYRSNLERVLPAVRTLLRELDGKTVVTSDHGNALGEFAKPFPLRVYGHPRGIRIPPLVTVPWHVYESGPRRSITSEPPVTHRENISAGTEDRLEMLGYK